jgi:hypothetical protein
MNCESVTRELPLFFYGELSLEEEQAIQDHLEACPSCRQAFQAEKELHELLDKRELEPSPALLAKCRRDLAARVSLAAAPSSRWKAWFFPAFSGRWQWAFKPLGALALVALGFFAARWGGPSAAVAPLARVKPEGVISRVRYVQPDPSGGIRILLEETSQRLVTGRPEDEPIQRLLLATASDSADPSLRGESLEILKTRPQSVEVRRALLQALQHDPNAGVRLRALEGLKQFATEPEVRSALAQALLGDDNPGVRTQAIDLLIQKKEEDMVGLLQELMQKESNNYVRLRCQRALQEMNASVGTF